MRTQIVIIILVDDSWIAWQAGFVYKHMHVPLLCFTVCMYSKACVRKHLNPKQFRYQALLRTGNGLNIHNRAGRNILQHSLKPDTVGAGWNWWQQP